MSPDLDTRVLCVHCGRRGDEHRGRDGRCPGKGPGPKWPRFSKKSEVDQGAIYDIRLARYWAQRTTTFKRVR